MIRFALMFTAAAALASPAIAGSYSATPTTAPATPRIVGKDIVWSCAGGSCQGSTDYGRSVVICQNLARKAGRLESFTVDGRALGAQELAKCNSSAKGGDSAALAKAN